MTTDPEWKMLHAVANALRAEPWYHSCGFSKKDYELVIWLKEPLPEIEQDRIGILQQTINTLVPFSMHWKAVQMFNLPSE